MLFHIVLAVITILMTSMNATSSKLSCFEKAQTVIAPWTQCSAALRSNNISIQILLHQSRPAEFERHVVNTATPGHPDYGKFLSKDVIKGYLRPPPFVIEKVKDWLQTNNFKGGNDFGFVNNGDIVELELTVEKAEAMFNTSFYYFTDHKNNTIIRALEYSLPDNMHPYVKTVVPIIRFPDVLPNLSIIYEEPGIPEAPPSFEYDPFYCNRTILPSCIQGIYQLKNFTALPNTNTTIGISGYLTETADVDSLHSFIATYAPYFPQVFPTLLTTDGSILQDPHNVSDLYTAETSLDLEYSSSVAPGIPITYYSTSGTADGIPDADQPVIVTNEPFMKQLTYLLSLPDDELPTVLSTSYGENEQTVPYNYANATCNIFAQLGARGVSVIFSSGDSGPGSACQRNDGTNATAFNPIFPASCPFVTSVGGTQFVGPEAATSFSSGGFSNYFPRPAYQDAAVEAYLQSFTTSNPNAATWTDFYNPHGRGFPDVSAQSFNFIIIDHMQVKRISGTSAAAPLFAGIIANLNALRISYGLPKLGFLNPWLYADGMGGFSDVTLGGSRGCTGVSAYSQHRGNYVPYAGWNATRGWDPVSGIGTPMWPRLVQLALKGAPLVRTEGSE